LLFTALLCRALVPMGFMPGAGGLVLCSGYAPIPAMAHGSQAEGGMPGMDMPGMDMSGNADHAGVGSPPQRHQGMEVCPFSAFASVMAVTHAQPVAAFALLVSTLIVFPPAKSPPRGTIVPTSLPRGPPTTV
jgi:hypothetical protein